MRIRFPFALGTSVIALGLTLVGVAAAQPKAQNTDQDKSAQDMCMVMMHAPGVTEQGKQEMRDFMQSPKAAEAMTRMMDMARRMGNGDPMRGMTKMMEMMGGQGGMMGGPNTPGMPSSK